MINQIVNIAHIVRKKSLTKVICKSTYKFIWIDLVSIAHIVNKISRTKNLCESTSTGCMNSPGIAQHCIQPCVHLSTLLVMLVWPNHLTQTEFRSAGIPICHPLSGLPNMGGTIRHGAVPSPIKTCTPIQKKLSEMSKDTVFNLFLLKIM